MFPRPAADTARGLRRAGTWPVVVVALAIAAATAACSPEDGRAVASTSTTETAETTVPATATTTRPDPAAAVAGFASCMESAGLPVPDIRLDATSAPLLGDLVGDLDPSDPRIREALTSCAEPLVAAGVLDVATDPELRAAIVERLEAYSVCMRREGISGFPDPVPGFDGSGAPYPPDQVPTGSVGFDEAAAVCAAEVAGTPLEG